MKYRFSGNGADSGCPPHNRTVVYILAVRARTDDGGGGQGTWDVIKPRPDRKRNKTKPDYSGGQGHHPRQHRGSRSTDTSLR